VGYGGPSSRLLVAVLRAEWAVLCHDFIITENGLLPQTIAEILPFFVMTWS